jgi:hypothetical protein
MSQLRRMRVEAVVRVGGAPNAPDWQAVGLGGVWVANATKQAVQRIDPATNQIDKLIHIGAAPAG